MTEQPAHALEEALKLFETLRRSAFGGTGRPRADDVWSQATREEEHPHFATGAPECLYCPICRTIAAARLSGTDVAGHVMIAGQRLYEAAREVVAAYERARPAPRPGRDADGDPVDIG